MTGTIIETRHELRVSASRTRFWFRRGLRGRSGVVVGCHQARLAGTAPKAMVFTEMTTKIALGCVVMRVLLLLISIAILLDAH